MNARSDHLAFTLAGRRHAIPLPQVQEVLRLPVLQPTEGMAPDIAGIFNLRGQVVPVRSLAASLGLPLRAPRAGDHLIVLTGERPALWVETIEGVVGLEALATDIAAQGSQLYHLLDPDHPGEPAPFPGELLAGVEPGDQAILEARSGACLEAPPSEHEGLRSVLSFELNGEVFAVDLAGVREIAPCPPIHPLPGAHQAYSGLASHRGEPLLVMDPRALIGLPQEPPQPSAKLLVIEEEGGRIGLYTDEVRDVLSLDPRDLHPPILEHGPWEWVEGEWVIDGRPVSLLRLQALLDQPLCAS